MSSLKFNQSKKVIFFKNAKVFEKLREVISKVLKVFLVTLKLTAKKEFVNHKISITAVVFSHKIRFCSKTKI